MGASDYMVDTTAPYRALASTPNYAQMLMQGIGSLGDSYFKGTQQAKTLAQQNAFPNGVIDPKTGGIDTNALINKGAQVGGLQYVQGLIPFLLQQQQGKRNAATITGEPTDTGGPAPAAGPDSAASQPQPGPMAPPIRNPGLGDQPNSLMSIATDAYGPKDAGKAAINLAKAFGIQDLNAPLQPEQIQQISRAVGPAKLASQGVPTPDFNGQPAGAANDAAMAGQSAPQGVTSSPLGTLAKADALDKRASALTAQAAESAAFPGGVEAAKVMLAEAQKYTDRAKMIREDIAKRADPTNEQKNARDPTILRTEARKEEQKGEIAQSQKTYNGIQAAAAQYERDLKPYLTLSRSILSTPGIYTGIGGNLSLDINKVRSLFGDTKAATLQAALQKVTATSVLDQINLQRDQLMEAGGTASRIFAQQVDLVQKAAPTLENTVEGNRFLVEVASRMGELHSQVATMAQDYKQQNGHLDAGFDRQLSNYLKAHPLFNAQEQEHPELLGAPALPPNVAGKQAVAAWGKGLGLKSGDPIRTPDGRVVAMP